MTGYRAEVYASAGRVSVHTRAEDRATAMVAVHVATAMVYVEMTPGELIQLSEKLREAANVIEHQAVALDG